MKEIAIEVGPEKFLTMFHRENTSDLAVMKQIWIEKAYDLSRFVRGRELQSIYESISSSGRMPLIIDAGANIGASSLYFSERYGKSRVVALEPEATNFKMLSINSKDRSNVLCLRAALSSSDGEMIVVDPGQGEWGFRAVSGDEAAQGRFIEKVPAISVNKILKDAGEECAPFIVKIDIEGGEGEVFSKNIEWVDKFPILIIELHDWMLPSQRSSASFIKCVSDLNRDFIYVGENVFSIKNF